MTKYVLILLLSVIPFRAFAYEVPDRGNWHTFVLSLINESRTKQGLTPVTTDLRLNILSQNQAVDSALHYDDATPESRRATYIENISSDGKNVVERGLDLGILNILRLSENVGLRYHSNFADLNAMLEESITTIHNMMLLDEKTRNVILDPKNTHVGIGLELHREANATPNTLFLVSDFVEYANPKDSSRKLTTRQFRSMIMKKAGVKSFSRLRGKHIAVLQTSLGDITLELHADAAPKTVTNFIMLAKAKFYDHLIFHRVIPDFMIQGGDLRGDGTGGQSIYGPAFADEINAESYNLHQKTLLDLDLKVRGSKIDINNLTLKAYYESLGYRYNDRLRSLPFVRGSIAMANSGPNTNGSQFFILQSENAYWLEGKHTVFGKVVKGMEVLDAIAAVARDNSDKPIVPVTFTVRVIEKPK